jgi:hypothetical protein
MRAGNHGIVPMTADLDDTDDDGLRPLGERFDDVLPDADGAPDAAEAPAAPPASAGGYWALSRTPLTSLVFTLPLVLAYEGGVLFLGRGSPRNGADVWLRRLLDALGFGEYFLLPVLTLLGLLAWHHVEHDRWRFSLRVLAGMAAECLFLAVVLVGIARFQSRIWPLAAGASAAHYVGPLGDTFDLYGFTFRAVAGLFFALLFLVRGFGIAAGTHAAYDMLVGLLP